MSTIQADDEWTALPEYLRQEFQIAYIAKRESQGMMNSEIEEEVHIY